MANFTEVETAAKLLTNYTRAIHYAQAEKKPQELTSFVFDAGNYETHKHIPHIPVLKLKSSTEYESGKKIKKTSLADNDSNSGHPAPDPLLLISKCASIITKRLDFQLTAAAARR